MPIYEYRCSNGHTFEVIQRMADDPVESCEECDAPVERVFHPVAVHFKGSGFYTTDYARQGSDPGSGEDKASSANKGSDPSGSSGGGSESKGDSSKSDSGSKGESKSSGSKGGGEAKAATSKGDRA
jgi:putative FmdB family regulatory protein